MVAGEWWVGRWVVEGGAGEGGVRGGRRMGGAESGRCVCGKGEEWWGVWHWWCEMGSGGLAKKTRPMIGKILNR